MPIPDVESPDCIPEDFLLPQMFEPRDTVLILTEVQATPKSPESDGSSNRDVKGHARNIRQSSSTETACKVPPTTSGSPHPAKHQSEAVAVARRLLSNGDVDAGIEVVNEWFCKIAPKPHVLRMIHYNAKNWPIIPFLPRTFRHVGDKDWGQKLHQHLKSVDLFHVYSMFCFCDVPGDSSEIVQKECF